MARDLERKEKGLLKHLGAEDEFSLTSDEIKDYLNKRYGNTSDDEVSDILDYLTDRNYISSKSIGKGKDRKELFYLTKYPLIGGKSAQKTLQGRGPYQFTKSLIRRITGVLFLIAGIGLSFYEGVNLTGGVIGVHTSGFLVGVLFIFIAFTLFIFKPKKK